MRQDKKAYFAASIGNILEFYDFALYGFYASILSTLFFPSSHPLISLLKVYGVFAVGFFSRIIGSLIFGWIGDRVKRKVTLSLSLVGIACATLGIGLLPPYEAWGIAAPICLIVLRMIQGVCIGGEYTISMVFISEQLNQFRARHPAFTTGLVSGMGVLGWFIASVLSTLFNHTEGFFLSWRIPFCLGSLIAFVGIYIRKHTEDATVQKPQKALKFLQILKEMFAQPKRVLQVGAIGAMMGGLFYSQFIFFRSFLPKVTSLKSTQVGMCISIGIFSYMIFLPVIGFLSDRIGHKTSMVSACALTIVLAPALFILATSGSESNLIGSQVIAALLLSGFMSPGMFLMSFVFPEQTRCLSASLSYNIGATLFGGLFPVIGLTVYRLTDHLIIPSLFLSFIAILATGILSTIPSYRLTTQST